MKKGFTLIELLAVILILGIIALIAIPTVNNIITEARYGAFKSSSDNIMKTVEQNCQTSLIKGENPVLSYLFEEGKSSHQIDVKGSLPNDGYILLDKDCNITDYYLSDNKNTYSNGDDLRSDYMLKMSSNGSNSIFKTMYPDYFDNIISIDFINNISIPGNAIEIKDPSVSENGKIKSWLIEDAGKYKLYVGSEKNIYANKNSNFLFKDITSVKSINLDNFKTSLTAEMVKFFENNRLESINVSKFDTSNVQNMSYIFWKSPNLKKLDLSNWDTRNVKHLEYTFDDCKELEEIDLTNWDTSNLQTTTGLFWGSVKLKTIKLSNWDTNNLLDMNRMFSNTGILELDLSNWNLYNITNASNFITNCQYINTIILRSAKDANKLANALIALDNPGKIIIKGDTTNLNKTLIESFNWKVYDSNGNLL